MNQRKVDIINHETVYDGYFRVERYRLRHSLHAGGLSSEIPREVFERGHAAAVLPLDPQRWEVVLIEQFRIGAYAAGVEPWLIEIVAGIIDDGETPEEVVRREALEEAGLQVSDLLPIAEYLVSPGGTSEKVSLFLGRVDAEGCGGIHGLPDEHEDIRVFSLPVNEALRYLDDGKADNALTVISLQWLALHEDEIRRKWAD